MAIVFLFGSVLLIAALPATTGDRGGFVTWRRCYDPFPGRHIMQLPDFDARDLDIRYCNFTELKQDQFKGLPNLESIEAYSNGMTRIHPSTFKHTPRLTFLDLSGNNFTELPVFEENSLPNLNRLELYRNFITGIYSPKSFAASPRVSQLLLEKNAIEYIHPDAFKPLTELRELVLNENKILFLYNFMFVNNLKLEGLFIEDNKLTYLPENFVSNIGGGKFHRLQVFGNPWNCACLLELIAEMQGLGLSDYHGYLPFDVKYNGRNPECVYSGPFSCRRRRPSLLTHHQ